MAALSRPTEATYTIHEAVTADTEDREDHTFCGIMFPLKAKDALPVHRVLITEIAVRGRLGPLTVWVTKDDDDENEDEGSDSQNTAAAQSSGSSPCATARGGSHRYSLRSRPSQRASRPPVADRQISMRKKHWTKIYTRTHPASFNTYVPLDLSSNPIALKPGQVRGVYIHSTLEGDEAIVYDNRHQESTVDDRFVTVLPGRAHVSETPFGTTPIWGWGNAWRDNREFVGRIKYGAVFRLWNPSENLSFGSQFQHLVRTLFLCQRRWESPFAKLPDDCIFFVLNMLHWEWAGDGEDAMRERAKVRRRVARRLALKAAEEREAEAVLASTAASEEEDEDEDTKMAAVSSEDLAAAVSNNSEFMVDDVAQQRESGGSVESDDDEDDDDEEMDDENLDYDDSDEDDSDDSENDYDEYRDMQTSTFHYRDLDDDDSVEERNQAAQEEESRGRQRRSFLRSARSQFARITVMRALGSMGHANET